MKRRFRNSTNESLYILLELGLFVVMCHLNTVEGFRWQGRWHIPCPTEDGFHRCLDGSGCIRPEKVCNKISDCDDRSDESPQMCSIPCNSTCSASNCQRTPNGPKCRQCPVGHRLDPRTNASCIDIDECNYYPPLCSQLCQNTKSSFKCSCAPGYKLDKDGMYCAAEEWKPDGPYLVYMQGNNIVKLSAKHDAIALPSVVHRTDGFVGAIAIDVTDERFYFYNVDENYIGSVSHDGTNVKKFITNGLLMVTGMAVDWFARNLYILDIGLHKIIVCALDTSLCSPLNINAPLGSFLSIAVNPSKGKLYWSECGPLASGRRIMEASMDGSNARVFIKTDVRCPTSLHIDAPLQTLYWSEADMHVIESVRLDGTNRNNITSALISQPSGVDVFEEEIFWFNIFTDDNDKHLIQLNAANKFLKNSLESTVLLTNLRDQSHELHVFHGAVQMLAPHACDHMLCKDICLLDDHDGYRCACGDGRVLTADQRACTESWDKPSLLVATGSQIIRLVPDAIWLDSYQTLLTAEAEITALAVDASSQMVYFATSWYGGRRNMDTRMGYIARFDISNPDSIFTVVDTVDLVTAISIDWFSKNIYWTDSMRGTVEMAKVDGRFRTVLMGGDGSFMPELPYALAVDPFQRNLYYSDCSSLYPHIGICDLAARSCMTSTFNISSRCVTSMTVSQRESKLFWTDSRKSQISSANFFGDGFKVLRHSPEPMSVAVVGDRIFWTDLHSMNLMFHQKGDADHKEKISIGRPLAAVVTYDSDEQKPGHSSCEPSNYGCSHLCVPTSDGNVCVCPSPLQLDNDGRTCISTQGDAKGRDMPNVQARRPVFSGIPSRMNQNLKQRPIKFNSPCSSGMKGVACEISNAVDAEVRQLSEEEKQSSNAWIIGIFVALTIIGVALITFYFVRRKGYLNTPAFVQFKTVLFGSRDDNAEHKTALVNPSYENPGYVDIDEDEMHGKTRKPIAIAPTMPSPDSGFLARKEYPYIKRLDTADP